jgi:DNA processing protein
MDTNGGLHYKIALSMIPKIGPVTARRLVKHVGSVEGVFLEDKNRLKKIPGMGDYLASALSDKQVFRWVEKELAFIERYNIQVLFYMDAGYPERLRNCDDAPVILYVRGELDTEGKKVLSIVGTRRATDRGIALCKKLVDDLAEHNPGLVIVSGLAYGVDICAHRAALNNSLRTIAVLGHGLDTIYPSIHRKIAAEITRQGALVSEFSSQNSFVRGNFVSRNRIIAGLADATVVVESGEKGGALITADIANSYNREVFAFPGRVEDKPSRGCNRLIKTNKASLIEGASDLQYVLGWEVKRIKQKAVQREMFSDLGDDARQLLDFLKKHGVLSIDELGSLSQRPVSSISPLLLDLEMKGLVRCLPGSRYKILAE